MLGVSDVTIHNLSGCDARIFQRALHAAGLDTPGEGGLQLVIADDYIARRLIAVNDSALRTRNPWLLVRPSGEMPWVGPLFLPGETACWACLRHRLVENRWWDHAYWRERKSPPSPAPIAADAQRVLAAFIAAELAKLLQTGCSVLSGTIMTFDIPGRIVNPHPVIRRTDCGACSEMGRPRLWAPALPLTELLQKQVSPITGIASGLSEVTTGKWSPIRIFASRCIVPLNVKSPFSGFDPETCVGRGLTRDRAIFGCMAECVERYSVFAQGSEAVTRGSFSTIGSPAVAPNTLLRFSQRQLREQSDGAPEGFDTERPVEWVSVVNRVDGSRRFVPAAYVYLDYSGPGAEFCIADSTGCAAGETVDDATGRGLLELIERDAAAIWWFNQCLRPVVPWTAFGDPFLCTVPDLFSRFGLNVWLLDITTDWAAPAYVAVSSNAHGGEIAYAFAAGLNPAAAAASAVTELTQTILSYQGEPRDKDRLAASEWRGRCNLDQMPFLRGLGTAGLSDRKELTFSMLLARANELGFEVLVADLTRPETQIPVVRVMAPGIQPLARRFAPGRLFDLPFSMGWRMSYRTSGELNNYPLL